MQAYCWLVDRLGGGWTLGITNAYHWCHPSSGDSGNVDANVLGTWPSQQRRAGLFGRFSIWPASTRVLATVASCMSIDNAPERRNRRFVARVWFAVGHAAFAANTAGPSTRWGVCRGKVCLACQAKGRLSSHCSSNAALCVSQQAGARAVTNCTTTRSAPSSARRVGNRASSTSCRTRPGLTTATQTATTSTRVACP